MVFEIERPRPFFVTGWLDQFNGLWQFVVVEIGTKPNNLGYPGVRACVRASARARECVRVAEEVGRGTELCLVTWALLY